MALVRAARASKRRVRLEQGERREQLLQGAASLFHTRAYEDVSIDDVASAAGVSKALVFHYFASKRELFVAVIERAAAELVQGTTLAAEAVPGEQPIERLRRGLDAYLAFAEAHADAYLALMRSAAGADPGLSAIVERTRELFAERLFESLPLGSEAAREPSLRLVTRGYIGFVEAASLAWLADRRAPRERVREVCVRALEALLLSLGSAA